jgi:single-stranded-DNA-specific exonuclease
MRGENRYLVKQGLKMLHHPSRPGLAELIGQARLDPANIDTETIAWVLGPRLNAAGRVEHASLSYQLLVTEDKVEGQRIAVELEKRNLERQRLTEQALSKARDMAEAQKENRLLLVASPEFSVGVAGLVAGKLVEEFRRPAIVVRYGPDSCRGSCRSIPEFDMVGALADCSNLLLRYGGHPMAAGFNLPTQNLEAFNQRLQDKAQRDLDGVDLRPLLNIDAELPLEQVGGTTISLCQRLAPFGLGNPAPTLLSQGVEVIKAQQAGNNGEHIRLKLKAGHMVWPAIAFRRNEAAPPIGTPLDIVYNLRVNHWGGESHMELNILDLQPATG